VVSATEDKGKHLEYRVIAGATDVTRQPVNDAACVADVWRAEDTSCFEFIILAYKIKLKYT